MSYTIRTALRCLFGRHEWEDWWLSPEGEGQRALGLTPDAVYRTCRHCSVAQRMARDGSVFTHRLRSR